MKPRYIAFLDCNGEVQKVRFRTKAEMFDEALAWAQANREALVAQYGHGYLYLEADTLEYLVGISHSSCARGWKVVFGTTKDGWNILSIQL